MNTVLNSLRAFVILLITSVLAGCTRIRLRAESLLLLLPGRAAGRPGGRPADTRLRMRHAEMAATTE